jgi:hypothetical protein
MEEIRCGCGESINLDSSGRTHCGERQESGPQQGPTFRNNRYGRRTAQMHVC